MVWGGCMWVHVGVGACGLKEQKWNKSGGITIGWGMELLAGSRSRDLMGSRVQQPRWPGLGRYVVVVATDVLGVGCGKGAQ